MKIIKKIFRLIAAILRAIYKLIDKYIVVPITKLILLINDRLGNRSDRFEKWITRKNTLIFISLVMAVILFLYVDNLSTTILTNSAEVLYDQKVEINYNNNAYVVEGLPNDVDVTLIGRQVDLYLAKQLSGGVVTADLSGLGEGLHTIELEYDCAITSVEYKLDPSVVNVTVYPKVSQTRTATIDIINESGLDTKLSIKSVELDTKEIVIKGAEHVLSEVATIKALVDVKKLVNPKVGTMTLDDVKLIAYDSDGKVVENVDTEPSKIGAKIVIESPSKEVPIKVVPTGELEFGKAIDSITTDITKITIYGDQSILDNIEYVPVEVDISKLNATKTYNVLVAKPSGIKEISATNVKITINIGEEVSRELTDVSIETINLDTTKYKAVAIGENSSKTTVVIKGTKNVVDSIENSMVKAQVDLEGYTEGEYEVMVTVTGDDNKVSYTSKTTKIKIRISKK